MRSKEKRFQDVTTKTRTDKQTNIWQTILFETEYFLFEKKNKLWSDSKPGPLPSQAYSLPPS